MTIPVVSAACASESVPAVPAVQVWAAVEVPMFVVLESATVAAELGAEVKATVTVSVVPIATVVVHETFAYTVASKAVPVIDTRTGVTEPVNATADAGATDVTTLNPKAATVASAMRLKVVFVDICFLSISRSREFPPVGFG
jgi:hypothetical protein